MKITSIIIITIASILIIINLFHLNFNALFSGDSLIALIGIVSGLCAILLILILQMAKRIVAKVKEQSK